MTISQLFVGGMSITITSTDKYIEKTGVKMKKNRIEIVLTHPETQHEIKVHAPNKIKMGFFQTLLEFRYGLPPLDVKPWDKKGIGITALVVLGIVFIGSFTYNEYLETINSSAMILGLGLVAYLYYITRNYFVLFIRSKLRKGYVVNNDEHLEILKQSGTIFAYTAKGDLAV